MKYLVFCNKLVRDRIPDIIAGTGTSVVVETLDRHAHILELKKKLKEEASEVNTAHSREQIIEELADLEEVIEALMLKLSITQNELTEIKKQKMYKNGGFDRGLFLKTIETTNNEWVAEKFLKQPDKYLVQEIPEL